MAEKFHDGQSNRTISQSSEDFVLQLILVIAIFIPLGFAGRFLANYIIGSGGFFSSIVAIVGTLLSVIIFLSLSHYNRPLRTILIGFPINTILLLFLYLFVWQTKTLTLRHLDVYLFRDGNVTGYGVLYYLPFAIVDSAISCFDFLIYSRFYMSILGGRQQ